MNHGSNNNNNNINGNNSNNQRNNWRSRSNRYNRYPNNARTNNSAQSPMKPQMKNQSADVIDVFGCSTDLVNSIKQSLLAVKQVDSISPADSPVEHNNGSPIHHRQSNAGLESAAALWQMDFGDWSPRKVVDVPPYPKCIPTLNGSPYAGGPSTSSPSPVGSSRGSTYSNSSPPQVISGGSSPMMSDYFPAGMNGGRRCSAEEMLCKTARSRSPDELLLNLHDINRASSSQSPENNYNGFNPIGGNRNRVDSRLSDDVNYAGYYPTCRSSESRSSEDLSIDHIMGEFRTRSPDSGVGDAKRLSNSSGSTKCNECTMDRVCDNCNDIYTNTILANAMDRVDSNQETPLIQEISSAMTALDIASYNHTTQNMPRSNQLALPAPNQIVLSNRQLNNMPKQQQQPIGYPVASQLALPSPSDDKPMASSSPLIFLNQRVMSDQPILYCSIHNGAQRFYCQTCSKLFCNECGPQHHVGHVTVHLLDATESAQKQADQVINECRFSMATIREDIDKGVIAAQTLDAKACEAVQSVRDLTRQLTEALRVRERELIEIIESTRKSKQQALQTREEGLKFGLARLSQTIEKLNRSVEASSLTSNPFDLYTAKDTASAQVFHIKAMRNGLPPPEDHYIKFQVMDTHIVETLRTLGNISTGNGHIGDRRVLSRHGMSSMVPLMPVPRGRAIAGANFTVSITNNRITPNGSPYLDIRTSILSIGGEFTLEENLCRPWGVACDREGHIVIADRSNNRIQIFRQNGSFVRRFGSHGTGRGQFDRPAGIAVDARRRIVVADKDNHRIQILTMEGEFLMAFGEKGTTPGLFNYPWDVATNDACQIVVSDTRNHRIQLFSPEGVFLRKFGFETQPQLWKCLDSPRGVAFTNEGNVLVTDFNNHRIVVVDADFLNARFLGCDSLSPHPMPPKTFLRPQGIAVDDNGHIIVCDSRNHRVQILDNNGVCRWRFGTQGIGPSQLDRPSGVAVTPDGKIVVVDFGNNRVLVF